MEPSREPPRQRRPVQRYERKIVVPEYPEIRPRPEREPGRRFRRLNAWERLLRRVNPTLHGPGIKDLYFFSLGLRTGLLAGVPVTSVFTLMADSVQNRKLERACLKIAEGLEAGEPIEELFRRHESVFPPFYREVFLSGLESGSIAYATKLLESHYKWIRELRSVILSVIWYPIFLMFAGAGIMAVRDIVIASFRGWLTPLGTMQILAQYYQYPCAGLALAYLASRVAKMKWVRPAMDEIIVAIPVIGGLFKRYSLAIFFGVLAGGVEAGREVTASLRSAILAMNNYALARRLQKAERFLRDGESFAFALERTDVLEPDAMGMVKAGEESASLDFLLRKIADFYMHTVKTYVPGLVKIFFPLTLIMVAWAFFVFPGVMFPAVFVMAFLLFLTI